MGAESKIEWTDATWNPVTGCTRVSEGCRNCYMARTVPRFGQDPWKVVLHPDRLDHPIRWQKPRRIFVNSLSDLFHEDVPDEFIGKAFVTMAQANRHTFQILTKRPQRMLKLMKNPPSSFPCGMIAGSPLPNVWLGVSVENQETADERIPILLQTPAAKRFISAEPLLGPVDLWSAKYPWPDGKGGIGSAFAWGTGVKWVIAGGESGPGARPMHPDWARSIRDQCQAAGVPFFFKQWGEYQPLTRTDGVQDMPFGGYNVETRFGFLKKGKKESGAVLDGREWKEWPTTAPIEEGE